MASDGEHCENDFYNTFGFNEKGNQYDVKKTYKKLAA
jgi:DnaJ-class molecular chaperone